MAVPKALKQVGWFVTLWAGGVVAILVAGFVIRAVLMP